MVQQPRTGYRPQRGDVLYAGLDRVTVQRVAADGSWADVLVEQFNSRAWWHKRQPVPFPADWDLPASGADR